MAYALFEREFGSTRFRALSAKGAQVQRPLWASTSTKNPAYPKTKYVDELVGADTVNTIPDETFVEYRRSGRPRPALQENWPAQLAEAGDVLRRLGEAGISIDEVTDALLAEGVRKFVEPMDKLLASIERKRKSLEAA